MVVRPLDQRLQVRGRDGLGLEPRHPLRDHGVHLTVDVLRGEVRVPPHPGRAEVRPGAVQPGPHLLTRAQALLQGAHLVRAGLPVREGVGDPVGQEERRVRARLVDAALPEEVQVVVGVQIEEAGQDDLPLPDLHHRGAARHRLRSRLRVHGPEAPLRHHDPRVGHHGVPGSVEQAAPLHDGHIRQCGRPLFARRRASGGGHEREDGESEAAATRRDSVILEPDHGSVLLMTCPHCLRSTRGRWRSSFRPSARVPGA